MSTPLLFRQIDQISRRWTNIQKINEQNENGLPPLHENLLANANFETIKALLAAGADPKLLSRAGNSSILCYICSSKPLDFKIIDLLLDHGMVLDEETMRQFKLKKPEDYKGYILQTTRQDVLKSYYAREEKLNVKAVGHTCKLNGYAKLETHSEKEDVSLEGSYHQECLTLLTKIFHHLSSSYNDLFAKEETTRLCDMLKNTFSNWVNNLVPKTLERIMKGLPTLIHTGFKHHAVNVLIWGPYFILCNRGASSRKPVEVHRFDPNLLDVEILKKITKTADKSSEEYEQLFFDELPKLLKFQHGDFEKALEDNTKLPYQVTGNCSWDSLEAVVWAFFALSDCLGIAGEQLKTLPQPDNASIKRALSKTEHRFDTWLAFSQAYTLERYLGIRHLRPPKSNTKVHKPDVRKIYTIDPRLVHRAFDRIQGRRVDFKAKHVDPRIKQKIGGLEKYLPKRPWFLFLDSIREIFMSIFFNRILSAF